MSERAPRITGRELLRALRRGGWEPVSQVGSHIHLKHHEHPGRVTVPAHATKVLKPATFSSILDQAGITIQELRELL
ncbi:MAG: type II toxin-antitoxin system HicA family toxin [Dehalococcoidia bacterium]|nr:type II toxin-antitoxin system HicA family toxin [Dehalococcoidia bacterium]